MMKSAVCFRSVGFKLLAGTQPADRLTVLSLVVSSPCTPRTACATASGRTTVGCVRSIALQLLLHRRRGGRIGERSGGRSRGRGSRRRRRSGRARSGERLVAGRNGARRRGARVGEALLGEHPQANERRSGVILAEIGPHAVDAAVIHEIGFLEAALAGDDVVGGHDHIARRGR